MMAEGPKGDTRIQGNNAETSIQHLSDSIFNKVSANTKQYKGDNPIMNGADISNNNWFDWFM